MEQEAAAATAAGSSCSMIKNKRERMRADLKARKREPPEKRREKENRERRTIKGKKENRGSDRQPGRKTEGTMREVT
jgi:hypothetical protein